MKYNDSSTPPLKNMLEVAMKSTPMKQTAPPSDMVMFRSKTDHPEFKKMPLFEQNKQKSEFCKREDIKEYLENKWKAELYNRDMYLLIFSQIRDNDQKDKTSTLIFKANEFKRTIKGYSKPFEALNVDFEKNDIPFLRN